MLGTMVPSYEMTLTTTPRHKTKIKPRISFEPDYAVAPGRNLLETIETLGIDQNELAERTGLTPKTFVDSRSQHAILISRGFGRCALTTR
jgi:hypothetical protein